MALTPRHDDQTMFEEPIVRPYRPQDHADVTWLYLHGIMWVQIDHGDTGADLDYIDDAYFADSHDCLWIAEVSYGVVGMVAVARDDDGIAEVRRLRVHPRWQRTTLPMTLLHTAVDHCRSRDYVKIIVAPDIDPEQIVAELDGRGLWCSRRRIIRTREFVEFYVDLYQSLDGDAVDTEQARSA